MKGALYIVSTPIGNLGDITLRALETLKTADLVAAEDTRQTRKLFSRFGIKTPLASFCGAKEQVRSKEIINRLKEGKKVALVSDAGTPGISDPGYFLVREAIDEGIPLYSIPGPSAIISALTLSGLSTASFVFEGFLPPKKGQRMKKLSLLAEEERTVIVYESPKRILKTLAEILTVMGDRKGAVAREITKIHEEVVRGNVSDIIKLLEEKGIKGEITLLVEGKKKKEAPGPEEMEQFMRKLLADGLPLKEGAARVAERFGVPKRKAYSGLLGLKEGVNDE